MAGTAAVAIAITALGGSARDLLIGSGDDLSGNGTLGDASGGPSGRTDPTTTGLEYDPTGTMIAQREESELRLTGGIGGAEPSGGGDEPSGGGDEPSGGGDEPSGGGDEPSGGGDEPSGGGTTEGQRSTPGAGRSTNEGPSVTSPGLPRVDLADIEAEVARVAEGSKRDCGFLGLACLWEDATRERENRFGFLDRWAGRLSKLHEAANAAVDWMEARALEFEASTQDLPGPLRWIASPIGRVVARNAGFVAGAVDKTFESVEALYQMASFGYRLQAGDARALESVRAAGQEVAQDPMILLEMPYALGKYYVTHIWDCALHGGRSCGELAPDVALSAPGFAKLVPRLVARDGARVATPAAQAARPKSSPRSPDESLLRPPAVDAGEALFQIRSVFLPDRLELARTAFSPGASLDARAALHLIRARVGQHLPGVDDVTRAQIADRAIASADAQIASRTIMAFQRGRVTYTETQLAALEVRIHGRPVSAPYGAPLYEVADEGLRLRAARAGLESPRPSVFRIAESDVTALTPFDEHLATLMRNKSGGATARDGLLFEAVRDTPEVRNAVRELGGGIVTESADGTLMISVNSAQAQLPDSPVWSVRTLAAD
jgi:hypothetical protein